MNHISVIAHGSPGSFVRRVQENPGLAVELLHAVRALLPLADWSDDAERRTIEGVKRLLRDTFGTCPRCEGSGRYGTLATALGADIKPPCSLCNGSGASPV